MKKSLLSVSLITITCLYGMLAAFVILLVKIAGGDILYAIIGSIIILIIQFLISPWITDLVMKFFYRAKFNVEIPDYLKEFIEKECSKHGVTYPKIGIIEDGAPNAFTYGRTKKDARIVITRGMFELLTEEEVIAVVGHEMGHIVHMDMLVMTFAQLVPLILYAIYEACTRSDSGDSDSKKGEAVVGLIAYILYIISQYIVLWLSRTREYYADSFSIEETRKPSTLASALVKVGFGLSVKHTESKHDVNKKNALGIMDASASKSMSISAVKNGALDKDSIKNAMKWEMWNPWAKWFEFNSTHPLISKRLLAISARCKEFNEEDYIVFDLKKEESYVDDFFFEILISFLPAIIIILSFIIILVNKLSFAYIGFGITFASLASLIKYQRAHRSGYTENNVKNLLSEVKVSHITSIPCIVKGNIIGKGNPGCIFNEDFVIKDDTGIIFLDYNQPMVIINKIFALFFSEKYFNKEVKVVGWYRRNPVPYIEIHEYTVDGKTKKIYTYELGIAARVILMILGIVLFKIL